MFGFFFENYDLFTKNATGIYRRKMASIGGLAVSVKQETMFHVIVSDVPRPKLVTEV
jgi:hypothetical protein